MERGYVKLWRKFQDSGLMQNAHALQLFCYLLVKAVHKERKFSTNGVVVMLSAGDAIFSRVAVSQQLNMSERNARTALEFLKKMEIVTTKVTNKFTIVSFVNWATYQKECTTGCPTESPTTVQQLSNNCPTGDHYLKNERKKESKNNFIMGTPTATNSKKFVPPSVEEVQDYCTERNNGVDAQRFVDFYTANGWMVGKNKVKDWKACVRTWERNSYQSGQNSLFSRQQQVAKPKAWDVQHG